MKQAIELAVYKIPIVYVNPSLIRKDSMSPLTTLSALVTHYLCLSRRNVENKSCELQGSVFFVRRARTLFTKHGYLKYFASLARFIDANFFVCP